MADRWASFPVVCKGGLDLYNEVLTVGTSLTGIATKLQNYEPSLEGGYKRILGYIKYDDAEVPGDTSQPVLAVKPALGGVFACRKDSGDDAAIYFSYGAGWSAKLNGTARTGLLASTYPRFLSYTMATECIIQVDGVNPAWKWDGSSETLINGTGAPTNPYYAEEWKNRIALAPASTDSSFLITAPNTDTDCQSANGAQEFNVGDTIVGLKRFRDTLYIFCENSIFKLTGNTSDDFFINPVTKSIGCIGQDTIQEVGGDLIFLAPDGLRSIAATERIDDIEMGLLSKKIQPLIRPYSSQAFNFKFLSCVINAKSQYRLFVYEEGVGDSGQRGFLGRYELRDQVPEYSWATTLGIPAFCSDSSYVDNVEISVFGHPTNGFVYLMEEGNTFDGEPINFVYRTPYYFFDEVESRKVLFKMRLYGQTEGDFLVDLNTLLDFQRSGIIQPSSITLEASGGLSYYGSAVYGTDIYSTTSDVSLDIPLVGSGIAIAFQFSDTNSITSHRIDSFVVEYATKGRR